MNSALQTSQSGSESGEAQFAKILKEMATYKKDNAALKEQSKKAMAVTTKCEQNYSALQFVYFDRFVFYLVKL